MIARHLASAALGAVLLTAPTPGLHAKRARVAEAAVDIDVELTDGPGAALASYRVRGTVLTKVVRRGADGAPVGVWRATLTVTDPLPGALAKLADGRPGPAPAADTPAAAIVVRRAAGDRRVAVARPPADLEAANTLAALDTPHGMPLVTLELAVLTWAGAKETDGVRPVTVRLTARGAAGAEVRVRAGDLALQMAEVRPLQPGVTPLPPEWIAVSEPAVGAKTHVIRVGAAVDVPLRAPVPAAGAFAVRAALAGTAAFRARGFDEQITIDASSPPLSAPAVESSRH